MDIERACIYCRGSDVAYQVGIAVAFIVDHGLRCGGIYVDEQGVDSWKKLMEDCARHYTDAIIIRGIETITENVEGINLLDELLPVPIIGAEDMYCTKENLDIETLQFEQKEPGRNRVKKKELGEDGQVLSDAKSQYKQIGGVAPFGYIKKSNVLIPNPSTAHMVEQLFIKAKDGEKITAIASWLEDQGILTSRGSSRWSENTIRDILKNSVYIDDLVSRELYDAVQERFDTKTSAEKRATGVYQGIVKCSHCGRPLAYNGIGGNDRRKTAVYSCKYHTGRNPKEQPLAHMPKIDEERLKAEVQEQCNRYICDMAGRTEKMDISIARFKKKQDTLESQLRKLGQRVQDSGLLYGLKITEGLWNSWYEARGRRYYAIAFRSLLQHRFAVYQPEPTAENDYEQEKKLYESITVDVEGKVQVHFWGDRAFR